MSAEQRDGLFKRWLAIELRSGKKMVTILSQVNAACGTRYRHNWPSLMASRGYALNHVPTTVRRYMMRVVLPEVLDAEGCSLDSRSVGRLIDHLT